MKIKTNKKPDGTSLEDERDREGLIGILESLEMPKKILFTEIELVQKISHYKSTFRFEIISP